MSLIRTRILFKNLEISQVIRRDYSEALSFRNVFSHEGTSDIWKRLQHDSNMKNISRNFELFKNINKKAAVLVPFCTVEGVPSVILTLRSSQLSSHSGQVSFPGGMKDKNDKDLNETALRESEEEIGLSRDIVEVYGMLPSIPGRDFDVLITPVIGFCGNIKVNSLSFNSHEVVEVFAPSLESLSDAQNISYTTFNTPTATYKLPEFLGQKHRVWGITAFILLESLKVLMPELLSHKFSVD